MEFLTITKQGGNTNKSHGLYKLDECLFFLEATSDGVGDIL